MEHGIEAHRKPRKVNWTKARLAMIGVLTDKDLAFKMKINPATVTEKRTSLGIERAPDHRQSWASVANRKLLGTMSDGQLAKRIGVTAPAVRLKRIALGIPAFIPIRKKS